MNDINQNNPQSNQEGADPDSDNNQQQNPAQAPGATIAPGQVQSPTNAQAAPQQNQAPNDTLSDTGQTQQAPAGNAPQTSAPAPEQQGANPPDFAGQNQSVTGGFVDQAHKLDLKRKKFNLVKMIAFAVIFSGGAIFLAATQGFPWIAVVVIIAVFGLFIFLSYKQLQKAPEHIGNKTQAAESGTAPSVDGAETLQFSVAGIMAAGGVRSTSQLGYGEVKDPCNAMLVTDQAVYFIYVPMKGGDQIVNSTDMGVQQWMWAYKKIREKLDEMMQNYNLQQIVGSDARNIRVDRASINEVKISKFRSRLTITTNQEKHSYSVRQKDDLKKLGEILS